MNRPGATKVESVGSYWFLDNDTQEYMRMPKVEAPRTEDREPLVDLVWHPMIGWSTITYPGRLTILLPDGNLIYAPLAREDA